MPTRPSPEAYHAFIDGLELINIRLIQSDVQAPGPPPTVPIAMDLETASEVVPFDGGFQMAYQAVFAFRPAGEDDADPLGRIACTFGLLYTSDASPEEDLAGYYQIFQEVNLALFAWPYVREFVQATIARMGWPPLTLPAYKNQAPVSDSGGADEEA